MNKRISAIVYIVLFMLVIAGIGAMSFKNLVNFYVNDEVDYNEWSADLGNKFETDIATTFYEKWSFVNFNGAIRNLLGQKEMNGVTKLNNGYLFKTFPYVDDEVLQSYADSVFELDSYLEARGTELIFAITPETSGKYDPQLPTGVVDYGNDNADRLMQRLQELKIDTIDFRDTMYEDGIEHYSMMYRTDHHWTTEAGFYAYQKLEKSIVDKVECEVDERISNIGNYTIMNYPEWHLGSRGQSTGRYFAGIDDFALIVPDFEMAIQRADGTAGNMQDIVYNMEPLKERNDMSRYTYDWVLGASLGAYKNLDSKNDVKILIITDSFGKAVCPFLIMGFSELAYVYDGDVSGVNPEYIEAYDPDIVICLYYSLNAMNAGAYTFSGFDG